MEVAQLICAHTSLVGQTKDMKEANGGLVLSYTSVPSIIPEIIGRTTACPCSGWWSTNVAGGNLNTYISHILKLQNRYFLKWIYLSIG